MTKLEAQPAVPRTRLALAVRGAVQGVGFRPFVFRLATALGLTGWVNNSSQGVGIEAEGARDALESFRLRLESEKPPRSVIQSLEAAWLDAIGYEEFSIRESVTGGRIAALVMPDLATCPDCVREVFDPSDRRYRYPFTNCTNCGPRFSIIEALPYDRANTSMKSFRMCPACQAEYDDPASRRFHAQPNACPGCGPQLELWPAAVAKGVRSDGEPICPLPHERGGQALFGAAEAIRGGLIAAVKGVGGFHLMVDARNEDAIRRLRERKQREEKPFALMFPDLPGVRKECEVSPLEERLLRSPEAPIVLLRRRGNPHPAIGRSVAPGNPCLGVMLPYSPLHHLLMAELAFPVVATSGNLSDEPICTEEREARERLRAIADVFLVHNRPIVRHVDDSIVRVMMDRSMVLRRARGYAPLPLALKSESQEPKSATVLAVGAHLKNSVALAAGGQVFVSQHVGDLETEPANSAFRRVVLELPRLYEAQPDVIAADLHPDYLSTKFACELAGNASAARGGEGTVESENQSQPAVTAGSGFTCQRRPTLVQVQHHVAHVLSCMAENELTPPVLGVSWDGTGYGPDGTIWGGEFFRVAKDSLERVAHLRPFRLPGGDAAIREPRRAALGLLHELMQHPDESVLRLQRELVRAFSPAELAGLQSALARGINSPFCSSMGRLFDAVAAIVGVRRQTRFEGQAAMELEFALEGVETDEAYTVEASLCGWRTEATVRGEPEFRNPNSVFQIGKSAVVWDWSSMIAAITADMERAVPVGLISAKFHNALAEVVVAVARRVGEARVALSGGCFQNRYLTERAVARLRAEGFLPYWHQRVPPNDGGISLGQVVAALRSMRA